jgi:NADH-quinone oxidoreductase subunit A
MVRDDRVEVEPRDRVAVAREAWMRGPGELHLPAEPYGADALVAVPCGSNAVLDAHVGELSHRSRREPVAAGLDPWQRGLLEDDHVEARVGQPVRAARPARTRADDDDVVHRRRDVVEQVLGHAPILRAVPGGFCATGGLVEMVVVDQYLPILGMLVLGAVFAVGSFIASSLLAPRRKSTDAKLAPYECGIVPEVDTPPRFPVRFYLVAMIFIIFDIEIVFLYPFAVEFKELGRFGVVEIVLFSLVVFGTLLFLVSEGALSWGPVKRLTRGTPARTSSSTIARITSDASDRAA